MRIAANEELRALEYGQRLRHRRRNCLARPGISTGRAIYEAARRGGMQALGLATGPAAGLAVGQPADIVVLDDVHPALIGRTDDTALDAWIFAAGRAVRHVFAAGRHAVVDGRHLHADAARSRYAATVNRLLCGL